MSKLIHKNDAARGREIVSNEMLHAAVKKACELGLFPRGEVDTNTYTKHWDGMKQCIQAALSANKQEQ